MSTVTADSVVRRRGLRARSVVSALLVFVPLAVMGEHLGLSGALVFTLAALSCVPLSYWLGQATEALGNRLGPATGGLLNATFGNAAEMIISIFALSHGLFIVVRSALIGSILGQLLLVMGTSLLLAGMKHGNIRFSKSLVQINFTLMVIAIGLPAVLLATSAEEAHARVNYLAPVLAIPLMAIYALAVLFSLRSQPAESGEGGPRWSPRRAMVVLAATTGRMVVVSELLVASIVPLVEETGISQMFIGLILIPIFGNVVDHIVAISVALKNKMDLSLTISVGSAAQVACLILPLIVLVSYAMGQPAGLIFTPMELIAFALGLMVPVLLDGFSNWLEGSQLLTAYLVLAAVLWAF